jgi:hypothetical protein
MTGTPSLDVSRAAWRTSRHSANAGNCIQVAAAPPVVAVRDSKDRHGPAIVIAPAAWHRFINRVKAGPPHLT